MLGWVPKQKSGRQQRNAMKIKDHSYIGNKSSSSISSVIKVKDSVQGTIKIFRNFSRLMILVQYWSIKPTKMCKCNRINPSKRGDGVRGEVLSKTRNIRAGAIASMPSSGCTVPETCSPKDKWLIRWEKLYSTIIDAIFSMCLPIIIQMWMNSFTLFHKCKNI